MSQPSPKSAITKVWAKNFRSIQSAELQLDPLTVLVGPNASGKSNLMDLLGFLGDTARLGLETAITSRGGIDSISRRLPASRVLGAEIGFQCRLPQGQLTYAFALQRRSRGEYRVKRESARLDPLDADILPPEVTLTQGRLTKPSLKNIRQQAKSAQKNNGPESSVVVDIAEKLSEGSDRLELQLMPVEPSNLISLLMILWYQLGTGGKRYHLSLLHDSLLRAKAILEKIGLYHIFPNSLRDPQKVADSHPLSMGGENLASTLREMIRRKSRFVQDLKEALTYAVPGVRDVRVSPAGSFYVIELNHERGTGKQKGSWFDLSLESDGTIRLLALLTALFQDPAPSLIGLEEPELAIHPGAMAVLSDNMKEAALRGQVLVATHSPDLIDRLPLENLRAVTVEGGSTKVGTITEHQLKSVKKNLFSPGELHSMEGLQPETTS